MERKLKPLRPALATRPADPDSNEQSDDLIPQKRKRVQVKVACDTCRAKKSACDGQRPVCAACVRRGSSCTFGGRPADTSDSSSSQTPAAGDADRHSDATELLTLLTSAPAEDALDLLNEIKLHGDYSLALMNIKKAREILQDDRNNHALWPPDQESVEFELMVRHPVLYPPAAPLDLRSNPTQLLARRASSDQEEITTPKSFEVNPFPPSTSPHENTPEKKSKPAQSASTFSDNRLERVVFSTWTKVPISNLEAASAVSRYLECDHAILGLFDADLFLDDLCANRTRFCSKFLVNALLSWVCLNASISTASPADLSALLLREALSYWEPRQVPDSLPAVAALQLLSLTATFSGQGERGSHLLQEGISMGLRMSLLGNGHATNPGNPLSELDLRAASQCAWGLFSCATLHSLHCQQGQLGAVPPPSFPIPPIAPRVLGASTQKPPPDIFFAYFCRLWALVHEVFWRYYSHEKSPESGRFDKVFVQDALGRFLRLGDQLPLPLVRGSKITHPGIVLHIIFHAGLLTLLRPLVLEGDACPLGLEIQTARPAEAISAASVNQLRRLVKIYLSHFSDTQTILWHTGCLYLANAAIRSVGSSHDRVTDLNLCLAGYRSLYPRYPVTIAIVKGILAMACSSDLITSLEAYEVVRKLRAKANRTKSAEDPTEARFVIDLDLALTDKEGAHIDILAQKFDDVVMFDEFTHGRIDDDGGVRIA